MIQKRDFWVYLLLSFFTCGIYSLIFWILYVPDINRVCDGDGKVTTGYGMVILLSILTCGIYPYIWFYQLGDRIHANGPRYGLDFSQTGGTILLWLILGSIIGIGSYLAAYFIITDSNHLFDSYNQYISGGADYYDI